MNLGYFFAMYKNEQKPLRFCSFFYLVVRAADGNAIERLVGDNGANHARFCLYKELSVIDIPRGFILCSTIYYL